VPQALVERPDLESPLLRQDAFIEVDEILENARAKALTGELIPSVSAVRPIRPSSLVLRVLHKKSVAHG
jgi:hypothetical protein